MIKITACYVVYNEADNMSESLRSVKRYVDDYIIVDGCFESNSAESIISTDSTYDICHSVCGDKLLGYIQANRKWVGEREARNRYLNLIDKGNWVLWLDGDEILYGDYRFMDDIFKKIRDGTYTDCVSIPVYTMTVNARGSALDVTKSMFDTNPLIATGGYMSKILQNVNGLVCTHPIYQQGVYDKDGKFLGSGTVNRTDKMFVINHHNRQSYEDYLNDARRVIKERGELAG